MVSEMVVVLGLASGCTGGPAVAILLLAPPVCSCRKYRDAARAVRALIVLALGAAPDNAVRRPAGTEPEQPEQQRPRHHRMGLRTGEWAGARQRSTGRARADWTRPVDLSNVQVSRSMTMNRQRVPYLSYSSHCDFNN
jgi:hypothetical protein